MTIDRRSVIRGAVCVGAFGLTSAWVRRLAAMVPPGMQALRGEARVNGSPVGVGAEIAPGDRVTTGPDAEAVFVVGEDAFLLRGDGEITLPEAGPVERVLTVISGRLLSVFGNDRLTIDTPVATIGIRGTGAYVETYEDRDYVCLCYGRAELRSKVSISYTKSLDTVHHDDPRMLYADPDMHGGRLFDLAPMVNHEDEELIMLEALVDRIPLFGPEPIRMR